MRAHEGANKQDTRIVLHPAEAAYFAQVAGHKGWHAAAERAMTELAKTGKPFSADDLRHILRGCEEQPPAGAWGGLFMTWGRRGLISRAGYIPSEQARNNGREQKLWVGTLADHAA